LAVEFNIPEFLKIVVTLLDTDLLIFVFKEKERYEQHFVVKTFHPTQVSTPRLNPSQTGR